MDNLSDFISGALTERGDTVMAFAARIGTSRQTVARWNASLPSAEMLRRVADDLDVPYSQVLVAALVSAGYIATPARSSANAWDISFYKLDADQLAPVLTVTVEAQGEPDKISRVECSIEDDGGLAATGIKPEDADMQFCSEPVVADIFK